MTRCDDAKRQLKSAPRSWAISGAAGFIGSNLLETLLKLDQRVTGLDNFATGHERNLDEVKRLVEPAQWARFDFIEGDVCAIVDCAHSKPFQWVADPDKIIAVVRRGHQVLDSIH